jgi:hypothetical protein
MAVGGPELFALLAITFVTVVSFGLILWPAARICRRIGFSPWLAALSIVPVGNLLLLWIVALSDWPADRGAEPARRR